MTSRKTKSIPNSSSTTVEDQESLYSDTSDLVVDENIEDDALKYKGSRSQSSAKSTQKSVEKSAKKNIKKAVRKTPVKATKKSVKKTTEKSKIEKQSQDGSHEHDTENDLKQSQEASDENDSDFDVENDTEFEVEAETEDENIDEKSTKKLIVKKPRRVVKKSEPEKKVRKAPVKISPEACENLIKDFLVTKVRPYLQTELLLTFKQEATKPDILNALNTLTEKGVLMKKDFAKKILYLATKQISNMPQAEIDAYKAECENIELTINTLKSELGQLRNELKTLCEYPKDIELQQLISQKKLEVEENNERMRDLSTGKIKVSKQEMEKIEKELGKMKKMLKERRMIFKNVVDVMIDNSGMKKAELYEEAGIEE